MWHLPLFYLIRLALLIIDFMFSTLWPLHHMYYFWLWNHVDMHIYLPKVDVHIIFTILLFYLLFFLLLPPWTCLLTRIWWKLTWMMTDIWMCIQVSFCYQCSSNHFAYMGASDWSRGTHAIFNILFMTYWRWECNCEYALCFEWTWSILVCPELPLKSFKLQPS